MSNDLIPADDGSDRLTIDRLALIERWAENFGLDLNSGIEAALATQEADHVAALADEVAFWKDQQKFATSAAATIADLDEEAPALRQMLRTETERRRRAEDECARLAYELACLKGEQP